MKTSMYILGSIEAMLGCIILSLAEIAGEIMPKLGRVAFQAAAAGSYSPSHYTLSLSLSYLLGWILVAAGIAQIVLAFYKKK